MIAALLPRVPLLAWALIAALAWGGWQRLQLLSVQGDIEALRTAAQAAAVDEANKAVAESIRRIKEQQHVIDTQARQIAAQRADAAAAGAAAERLRARLAAVQADAGADSTAAAVGSAARTAASVLADLLGRCSERRRELAEHADAAGSAGRACEQSYDALTP